MEINRKNDPVAAISPVLKEAQLIKMQEAVNIVKIDPKIMQYIANLVQATRTHKKIRLGASPRGSIALMKAGQALALIQGKEFVTAQMVQSVAKAVLGHRVLLQGGGDHVDIVLDEILERTRVPAMPTPTKNNDGH
jgi:MoxR-like ATPase